MSARRRERPGSAPSRRGSSLGSRSSRQSTSRSSPKQLTPLAQKSASRIAPGAPAREADNSPPFKSPDKPHYAQPTTSSKVRAQVVPARRAASRHAASDGHSPLALSVDSSGSDHRYRRPRPGQLRRSPIDVTRDSRNGANHPLGGWVSHPRHSNKQSLWYARWAETQPHPSFDIDGDGVVSSEDLERPINFR